MLNIYKVRGKNNIYYVQYFQTLKESKNKKNKSGKSTDSDKGTFSIREIF